VTFRGESIREGDEGRRGAAKGMIAARAVSGEKPGKEKSNKGMKNKSKTSAPR